MTRWDGGGLDDGGARLAHRQHAADVEARRRKHRLELLAREVPDIERYVGTVGQGVGRGGRLDCLALTPPPRRTGPA